MFAHVVWFSLENDMETFVNSARLLDAVLRDGGNVNLRNFGRPPVISSISAFVLSFAHWFFSLVSRSFPCYLCVDSILGSCVVVYSAHSFVVH